MAAERELPPLRVRLFGADAGFNKFVDDANRRIDMMASRVRTAGQSMAQSIERAGQDIAMKAGLIGIGLSAAMAAPITLAANYEQTTVAFEVLLGSAEKATTMLKDIENLAIKTPFETKDLEKGAQMLAGYGVAMENILPDMTALGDVAMGNVNKFDHLTLAFGQIQAKGKLMAQEVNQMTEQGFNPLAEISRTTGKSIATLMDEMEKGKISAAMVREAFRTATSEGGKYHNMSARQSQTLIGLTSTMKDYINLALRAVGDAMLPTLKARVEVAITYAKVVRDWVTAHQEFSGAVGMTILNLGLGATAVATMAGGIATLSTVTQLLQRGLAGVVATTKLLTPALYGVRTALIAIRTTALPMLAPLVPYIAVVGALAAAVGLVSLAILGPRGMAAAWTTVTEAMASWYNYAQGWLYNFTENWAMLSAWIGANWRAMLSDIVQLMGLTIGAVINNWLVLQQTYIRLTAAFIGWLSIAVPAAWDYVFSVKFLLTITEALGKAADIVQLWLNNNLQYLAAFATAMSETFGVMLTTMVDTATTMLAKTKEFIKRIMSGDIDLVGMMDELVTAAGTKIVEGAQKAAEKFDKAAQTVRDAYNKSKDMIVGDYNKGASNMDFTATAGAILAEQRGKLQNPLDGFKPTTSALPAFNTSLPPVERPETVWDPNYNGAGSVDKVLDGALKKKEELSKPMTIKAKADFSAVGRGTAEAFDRLQDYASKAGKAFLGRESTNVTMGPVLRPSMEPDKVVKPKEEPVVKLTPEEAKEARDKTIKGKIDKREMEREAKIMERVAKATEYLATANKNAPRKNLVDVSATQLAQAGGMA